MYIWLYGQPLRLASARSFYNMVWALTGKVSLWFNKEKVAIWKTTRDKITAWVSQSSQEVTTKMPSFYDCTRLKSALALFPFRALSKALVIGHLTRAPVPANPNRLQQGSRDFVIMNPAMAAQYRYQQAQAAQQRPPHPTPRRGAGPMLPGPHGQMYQASPKQQHQVQQSREEHFRELFSKEAEAKLRAQKPTDRNIPDGIEDLIVGNGVQEYKRLREVERRLDATMTRKRLELQEQRLRSMHHTKKLRVWISNTAENQPWQGKELDENAFDFNSGSEATYKVQIVGKLLEDEDGLVVQEAEKKINGASGHPEEAQDGRDNSSQKTTEATASKPQFSHFFKSITVELDRAKALQQDASNMMEWKKPPLAPNAQPSPTSADFDSLQFERKSDENINCTINLYRDEKPERFALSRELSEVVEGEDATREQIMTAIWMYIKAQGLQRDEEKRLIQCDDALRAVCITIFCLP